jgi:solute carrier family 25 protein 33/36
MSSPGKGRDGGAESARQTADQEKPKLFSNRETLVHFVAGGMGGAVGALLTNPLDVVRTRFQAKNKSAAVMEATMPGQRWQILKSMQLIAEKEGIRGLFRGLTPNLVAIVPARSLYFMTYSSTKQWLAHHGWSKDSILTHSAGAVMSGIVTSTAINPIWVVKVRIQLQAVNAPISARGGVGAASVPPKPSSYYNGYMDAFSRIWKEEGPRAFYKGLGASLLGISETVMQFIIYEKLKSFLDQRKHKQSTPFDYLLAGGFSKFCAASITYPHEVLRTRLREQRSTPGQAAHYQGIVHACKTILREEGLRAMYGGFGPHMLRVVPNTAIIFGVYELVVDQAKRAGIV